MVRVTPPRLEPQPMLTPARTRCGNIGGQPELLLEYWVSGIMVTDVEMLFCYMKIGDPIRYEI